MMTKNNDQVAAKNAKRRRLFRFVVTGGAICALGLTITVLAQGQLTPDSKRSTIWQGISIDRDRVEPRYDGPKVPHVPNTVAVLLHRQAETGQPIIVLRIPEQYVRSSVGQTDSIGLALYITYPDMKGSFAPQNSDLFNCVGLCHGLMIVELRNNIGSRRWEPKSVLSSFPNNPLDRLRKPVDRLGTFDEAYAQPLYTFKGSPSVNSYILKDNLGKTVSVVKCEPDTPTAYCDEWLESKKVSGMIIHYTFQYRFLSEWKKVHQSVLSLIDGFFVQTLKPIQTR